MWRYLFAALLVAAVLFQLSASGCRRPADPIPTRPSPSGFTGTAALDEVRSFLENGPRDAGTPGAEKAARYLADRLAAAGIRVETDTFHDLTPDGTATFRNVIGRIPGKVTGIVLLGAHYDTKSGIPGFQGANDSGSGVGLLLALARWYAAAPPMHTSVWFAFLDGEECRREYGPRDGLHGSRRLARTLVERGLAAQVRAVVVVDMVGDRDLRVTLPRNGTPALMSALFAAAQSAGYREVFGLHPGGILDDHQPFLDAGMPAVDLIDFEYGLARGLNDYWHTPADTVDKLDAGSLEKVGRVLIHWLDACDAQASSASGALSPPN